MLGRRAESVPRAAPALGSVAVAIAYRPWLRPACALDIAALRAQVALEIRTHPSHGEERACADQGAEAECPHDELFLGRCQARAGGNLVRCCVVA